MLPHVFKLSLLLYFAESITIKINDGKILGTKDVTEGLKLEYFAFKGIPYAEPPKRFELPVPKKPWNGILNCTSDRDKCLQGGGVINKVTGSENCLFLSVYTRNLRGKSPVLVWIHGGGFFIGDAFYSTNGPDYLLDENLVVVQIQYRLGVLGFMSTGDKACPGNLGLKDQLLALKWVQSNIHFFGGDSKKVTIMGQSAGAASVSMHLNSPKSVGLFKGAIMNSGVSICFWSLSRLAAQITFRIGSALGIATNNSFVLVDKLKTINSTTLQNTASTVSDLIVFQNPLKSLPWAPVKEIEHETAFFTGKSYEMLKKGQFTKVPVLAGYTSNEGAGELDSQSDLNILFRLLTLKYDLSPMDLVPTDLTNNFFKRLAAAFEIKNEFFGKYLWTASFAPTNAIMKFLNVDLFVRPINKFVELVSNYVSNTYYYIFDYKGNIKQFYGPNRTGTQHAEDLNYIFRRNYTYSKEDQLFRKRVVRMWANFCKFSKPTLGNDQLLQNVNWGAYSKQNRFLMNISKALGPVINPYQQYIDFYEGLFKKYGDNDYDTY